MTSKQRVILLTALVAVLVSVAGALALWPHDRGPAASAQPAGAATTQAAAPEVDQAALKAAWETWKTQQDFTKPDRVPPIMLAHFDWYEAKNWSQPYPDEDRLYLPNEVPGAYFPPNDSDG
jgi:hypothetical protein